MAYQVLAETLKLDFPYGHASQRSDRHRVKRVFNTTARRTIGGGTVAAPDNLIPMAIPSKPDTLSASDLLGSHNNKINPHTAFQYSVQTCHSM